MPTEPAARDTTNRDEIYAIVLSVFVIGMFLYRVFTPAHEMPLRHIQVMTMLFDAGMLAGLFGLKSRLTGLRTLLWIAIAAGIGLFLIRLTGDTAWWSGHLTWSLR